MIRRIKGRQTTKLEMNGYFPKIVREEPSGWVLVESSGGLSAYPDSQVVFEPVQNGFGGYNRSLIVRTNRSTPAQVFTISQGVIEVYWEDEFIEFGDEEFTFGG